MSSLWPLPTGASLEVLFGYLFARPTPSPPGESSRLGVTKGQLPGVIGLALVDTSDAPIAAMRELYRGLTISSAVRHRDYNSKNARGPSQQNWD